MAPELLTTAMMNRSLRTIRNELEFLTDTNIISQQQLSSILSQLPLQDSQNATRATQQSPIPTSPPVASPAPLVPEISDLSVNNEKKHAEYYAPSPSPAIQQQPPPSYVPQPAPIPAPLAHATALYPYTPTDAGDLALVPNDRIAVTAYMNSEWWKGRSERTGLEGIFPRSYVRVDNLPQPGQEKVNNYGNVPLEVSQTNSDGDPVNEQGKPTSGFGVGKDLGKKFGRKLGNAAIFGAGATMGSNLVNGII